MQVFDLEGGGVGQHISFKKQKINVFKNKLATQGNPTLFIDMILVTVFEKNGF